LCSGAWYPARSALCCARNSARRARDSSGSEYNAWATLAGPRLSLTPSTMTSWISPARSMRRDSPPRNTRAGLARWPSTSTLPVSTACFARLRVL
jgi:hypothetical protein